MNVNKSKYNRIDYCGREVSCQTLGILGTGRIGTHLAEYGKALFGGVLCWDNNEERLQRQPIDSQAKSMYDLLERSDTLCISVNYIPENFELIGHTEISHLKRSSCIVNISRGEIVNEVAIANAIRSGKGWRICDRCIAVRKQKGV